MSRVIELACLCGARVPDTGQALPAYCTECKRSTMGEWKGTRRVSRPEEGGLL